MMRFQPRRLATALALAALLMGISMGAGASQATVTFQILPAGSLRAFTSIESPFGPITFSNSIQHDSARLSLAVSDARGTAGGWSVVLSSTDFRYRGDSPLGLDLPNRGFVIVAAGAPELIAGQPIGAGGPYALPLAGAGLNDGRRTVHAEPGWGSGGYAQPIGLSLTIPARSQPGAYVATLTIAMVSGP